MKTYMATYKKQDFYTLSGKWMDDEQFENRLFIFAETEDQAEEQLKAALRKLNQHAHDKVRYIEETKPKEIIAMSVSHNLACGTTSVNGIWE